MICCLRGTWQVADIISNRRRKEPTTVSLTADTTHLSAINSVINTSIAAKPNLEEKKNGFVWHMHINSLEKKNGGASESE